MNCFKEEGRLDKRGRDDECVGGSVWKTKEEAEKQLEKYEETDKKEGTISEDFYEIVTVVNN